MQNHLKHHEKHFSLFMEREIVYSSLSCSYSWLQLFLSHNNYCSHHPLPGTRETVSSSLLLSCHFNGSSPFFSLRHFNIFSPFPSLHLLHASSPLEQEIIIFSLPPLYFTSVVPLPSPHFSARPMSVAMILQHPEVVQAGQPISLNVQFVDKDSRLALNGEAFKVRQRPDEITTVCVLCKCEKSNACYIPSVRKHEQ